MRQRSRLFSFSIALSVFVALGTFQIAYTGVAQGASLLEATTSAEGVEAAKSLGAKKNKKNVGVLLDGLAMGLSAKVAVAALDALGQIGDAGASDTLHFYSHHRSPQVRLAALRAIVATGANRREDALQRALVDSESAIRSYAAKTAASQKMTSAMPTLMELMKKGDAPAGAAVAALANGSHVESLVSLNGTLPDGLYAQTLGSLLMRKDFGPEKKRVEVVTALAKIPGPDTIEQLSNYVEAIPEKPERESRSEADRLLKQRMGQ